MKLEKARYLHTHLVEIERKIYKYKMNISLRQDWKPSNFAYKLHVHHTQCVIFMHISANVELFILHIDLSTFFACFIIL